MTTKVADSFVNEESALFLRRDDIINRWGNVASSFQELPGLVGFWPMSSVQRSTGNAYDLSGQGRTLTYNGNPTYNIYNGIIPYIDLDGTGDYLTRADETDLDILGSETIYASAVRGLTMGGWVRPDTLAPGIAGVMGGKSNNAAQKSWDMFETTTGTVTARVSVDGTAVIQVTSTNVLTTNWNFACMQYVPSTSLTIFVNGTPTTNTTSIPASIFNSTSSFALGAFSPGGNAFLGHLSNWFLSANALSDALVFSLFEQSRSVYGV